MIRSSVAVILLLLTALAAQGQGFSALARLDPDRSGLDGQDVVLHISQPVPYRVFTLDNPARLVLDFREVAFDRLNPETFKSTLIKDVAAGRFQEGWTRFVAELSGPYGVAKAGMSTEQSDGSAVVRVSLTLTTPEAFAAKSGPPPSRAFGDIQARPAQRPTPRDGPMRIVLDPGHGGIDPGAIRDGVNEADLVLGFARELREALVRQGGYEVRLTRDADEFVSLEARIALAKRAQADLFLSIHADAVSQGIARGAQIFTLAEEASSRALELLAERHDRGDLLAGVDLTGQADEVALVLMSIARMETQPRTDALAQALVDGLIGAGVRLHKRPLEHGAFSVLKAPDLPAALIEIGFMSSPEELKKLQSPEWRAQAISGLVAGVQAWEAQDKARRALIRQ